jgi:bla regulator protein blaR1
MRFRQAMLTVVCGTGAGLLAQTGTVRYEAASIKRSASDERRHGIEFLSGGRFRATNMPLLPVLAIVYKIPFQSIEVVRLRIRGMPDWLGMEPYDIEATPEKGWTPGATAQARQERTRLMLQSLLADRLQLKVRREMTEMPVYAMVVKSHGPTLEKAKITEEQCGESVSLFGPSIGDPGCHQFRGGVGRGLLATAVDMADLALYVSNWSDLPVVDQTGLTGLYALKTEGWRSTYDDDPSRPTLEDIFDRLGLRLIRKKGPVEILTIEHVERPSAN